MNYFDELKEKSNRGPLQGTARTFGEKRAKRVVFDIAPPESHEGTQSPRRISQKYTRPAREEVPVRKREAPADGLKEIFIEGDHEVRKEEYEASPHEEVREEPAAEPSIHVTSWVPENVRRVQLRKKIAAFLCIAAAATGFALPTFVFPKLSISLTPRIEKLPVAGLALSADTSLSAPNSEEKILPAILVATENTFRQEYETTGKKFLRTQATGTVRIFNAFNSSTQRLIAGTRLQESSGKIFLLTSAITVPGATVENGKVVPTSVVTDVIAEKIGETYNIGTTEFRIPGFRGTAKYDGFYAKSESPFSGGFEGEARIVTAEDIKRASEDLTKRAVDELGKELQQKIPAGEDFLMPGGAREISIVQIDQPKPGERFDKFPLAVTARGRLFAIRKSHLHEMLQELLLTEDNGEKQEVLETQDGLTVGGVTFGPASSQFSFSVSGNLAYWRPLNTESIASIIQTSTPKKAEAYLRGKQEISSFRIKQFPAWLWFMPKRAGSLQVEVETPDRGGE